MFDKVDDRAHQTEIRYSRSFLIPTSVRNLLIEVYQIQQKVLLLLIITDLPIQYRQYPNRRLIRRLPMIHHIHKRLQALHKRILPPRDILDDLPQHLRLLSEDCVDRR